MNGSQDRIGGGRDRGPSAREAPAGVAAIPPEWLWAYADGILDPNEEELLRAALAQDPASQVELERIREALAEVDLRPVVVPRAAVAAHPSLAAIVRRKLERLRAELEWEREELAAGFALVGEGLLTVFRGGRWSEVVAPQRGLAYRSTTRAVAPRRTPTRVEVKNQDSVGIAVVREPEGGITLILDGLDRTLSGWVRVWKRQSKAGAVSTVDSGCAGQLREGTATITGCPTGGLSLRLPDGRSYSIIVLPLEGAAASRPLGAPGSAPDESPQS
ncbi:MAG: hypothetical protein FJ387_15575 [Verrucomicrobia bacterium]|nr:hypothetical protein [Verrucomicrobiota bacterium]